MPTNLCGLSGEILATFKVYLEVVLVNCRGLPVSEARVTYRNRIECESESEIFMAGCFCNPWGTQRVEQALTCHGLARGSIQVLLRNYLLINSSVQ
jgi:hypothetical protein